METVPNKFKRVNLKNKAKEVRVAITSDTHSVLDENIAAEVAQCDVVLHAGDICGNHVLDELASLCDQVIAVTGNNDVVSKGWRPDFSGSPELLPQSVLIELPGGNIAMEHGHRLGNSPSHDALRAHWPNAKIIVYGHTHKQLWDKAVEPWVINPGAAGETRTQGGASCAILIASEGHWDVELKKFPDVDSEVA